MIQKQISSFSCLQLCTFIQASRIQIGALLVRIHVIGALEGVQVCPEAFKHVGGDLFKVNKGLLEGIGRG